MYRISFIGAGNVAFRMSLFLQAAGHTIECVCNRDIEKAEKIVRALKRNKSNAFATTSYSEIPKSDILIIAVSDNAISEVAEQYPDKSQFTVHTSGATSVDVLKEAGFSNYGIFYPLMTLSANKDLDIKLIPFLLEANNNEKLEILKDLTSSIKAEYKVCDSQKRLQFHTAAVFATNFINYILSLAYDISNPEFTFLMPSAIETVRKAFLNTPTSAQTGPARRGDTQTIQKHLKLLKDGDFEQHAEVYKLLTEKIVEKYSK